MKQSYAILRYHTSICLEQLKNIMETLTQGNYILGIDFDLRPCRRKAGVLLPLPQCSVKYFYIVHM
jgi:hypothetical protein